MTLEAGTGLVHTAPGHGQELRGGAQVRARHLQPLKHDGRYDDSVGPELAGKKVFEANPIVIQTLVDRARCSTPPPTA